MIDLEAIRYRRLGLALESTSANRSAALTMGEVGIDIDALLAEVERLTASTNCIHCAAERDHGTGPFCYDHREPQ